MKEYNYPEIEQHIQEHRNFINRFKELREKHPEYSEEALDSLTNNISKWIDSHITQNDMKLGEFILSKEKMKIS